MSDDAIVYDPSHDDVIIRPGSARCWWCWLITWLLVAAVGALLVALWWTATKPVVNAYPVWCDEYAPASARTRRTSDDGYEPAIPSTASSLAIVSTARAQEQLGRQPRSADANLRARIDRYVDLRIAQADGSRVAYELLDDDPYEEFSNLGSAALEEARDLFEDRSIEDGVAGFYRLALAYLDTAAFDIALADKEDRSLSGHDRLVVPFCPYSDFVADADVQEAFSYLVWAAECDNVHPPLFERWMEAIIRQSGRSAREAGQWRATARREFAALAARKDKRWRGERKLFCIGLPKTIIDDHPPPDCPDARNARQALKLGDAAQALGNMPKARACWRVAIGLAQTDPEGAPAAVTAQQRLQANSSTCKWTTQSVATISRDYRARSGDLIHMKVIQQALKALGHYDGPIDGVLSPVTRAAIRKFQRSVGTDETDTLTPLEITQLICNSAETTRDLVSVTTLGVMYAVGLGVQQDVDQAQQWLAQASTRRYADATYNLSILYGTGIILNSYRLCDAPRMPEQADRYLNEAADQGHPIAQALLQLYGSKSKYANLSPRERWTLIEMQQLENSTADRTGIYATKLAIVGSKCAPDRSIR